MKEDGWLELPGVVWGTTRLEPQKVKASEELQLESSHRQRWIGIFPRDQIPVFC